MRRLRILCLHGYHGSAAILRGQLRPLAASVEEWADFVYVDAPSLEMGDFGWWHAENSTGDAGVRRTQYKGWARTRDWIRTLCAEEGPFDGVFGFSQGAALAALLAGLCALEHNAPTPSRLSFDFAMMAGGFVSGDNQHAPLYESLRGFDLPSLHIIGRADGIVSPRASLALASRFEDALVLEHDGGHVIAATPEIRDATAGFLRAMAQRPPRRHAGRAGPFEVPLWRKRAHPAMRVFLADGARTRPRPAMVVFRGGAYARSDGSGDGAAQWAARHGMVGIEVDYGTRSTNSFHPASYADAARSVRLVRQHAAEWGVDPARVGVMGFSAGGHLASLLSTQPALWISPDDDLAPRISARPNLVVLAYPLISFIDGYSPGRFVGSVENFFGRDDVDESTRRQFSSELHVEGTHPPVFIWTTVDDALVPYTHSQRFADACRRAHVPVELTLYPHGPHGMGLALDEPGPVREWTQRLLEWLAQRWGPL